MPPLIIPASAIMHLLPIHPEAIILLPAQWLFLQTLRVPETSRTEQILLSSILQDPTILQQEVRLSTLTSMGQEMLQRVHTHYTLTLPDQIMRWEELQLCIRIQQEARMWPGVTMPCTLMRQVIIIQQSELPH